MICETHETECNVCELIEQNVKSAGAYYFAGLVHGVLAPRVRVPLCVLHFAAWQKVEAQWKTQLAAPSDAAQ